MSKEIKADYTQQFLLPPSLESWVPPDHPARFIKEFVESIDLDALNFKKRESIRGRSSYSNSILLKVWLYGYFEKIYSSRNLERACKNEIPFIWLTGMNYPDHNTIWRFFKKNKSVIKNLFKQTVQVAVNADMVGFALQAVDGTKIRANASKRLTIKQSDITSLLNTLDSSVDTVIETIESNEKNCKDMPGYSLPEELQDEKKLKESVKKGLKKLSKEEKIAIKDTLKNKLVEMKENNVKSMSLVDKDASFMNSKSKIEYCYNAQATVDSKNQVIVGSAMTNEAADTSQLVNLIDSSVENTGVIPEKTLADGGYFSGKELAKAEKKDYSVLVKIGKNFYDEKHMQDSLVSKKDFIYDENSDVYHCPLGGKKLTFTRIVNYKKKGYSVRAYNCKNFKSCPYHKKCSNNKEGRQVQRSPFEKTLKRHIKKIKKNENRELLKQRNAIVEPIFGWIKFNNKFSMWSYRGLNSVEAQWYFLCATINLQKIYKKWVLNRLII